MCKVLCALVAVAGGVISILFAMQSYHKITYPEDTPLDNLLANVLFPNTFKALKTLTILGFIFHCTNVMASGLVVFGICKNKRACLMPWLINGGIYIIVKVYYMFSLWRGDILLDNPNEVMAMWSKMLAVVGVCWMIIFATYINMKNKDGEVIFHRFGDVSANRN